MTDKEILENTCFIMWMGGLFVMFTMSMLWAFNITY